MEEAPVPEGVMVGDAEGEADHIRIGEGRTGHREEPEATGDVLRCEGHSSGNRNRCMGEDCGQGLGPMD